jgi:hypothetical protein
MLPQKRLLVCLLGTLGLAVGRGPSGLAAGSRALSVTCWTKPLREYPEYGQNPCKLNGDFDGDRRTDIVEQVMEAGGKRRRGLRVTFANGRTAVLGAGVEIGNGGDSFDWMDGWKVVPPQDLKGIWLAKAKPSGDVLLVASAGNASGLVGWVKGRPHWEQADD